MFVSVKSGKITIIRFQDGRLLYCSTKNEVNTYINFPVVDAAYATIIYLKIAHFLQRLFINNKKKIANRTWSIKDQVNKSDQPNF